MSHDAILISVCAGAALVLYLISLAYRKAASAIRAVCQRWDATMKMAEELKAAYAEIKAGQSKDAGELRDAILKMNLAMETFGEPLAAVPNILKSQVGGLMALKETIEAFSKTIIGSTQGNHIEPDERREAGEDEILKLLEHAASRGQRMSREEAVERLENQNLWKRMGTLIPNGSDD